MGKLLTSTNNKLIFGTGGKLVHSDLVFDNDYIYITITGLWEADDDDGYLYDGHTFAVGYGTTYGLYMGTTPTDATEKASMKYWLPVEAIAGYNAWGPSGSWPGPYTSRFDYAAMFANDYGMGNDGTNDYYEITVRCDQYPHFGVILDNNYCKVKAWKNLDSIEATYTPATVTEANKTTSVLCTIRWTPATTTLEFV